MTTLTGRDSLSVVGEPGPVETADVPSGTRSRGPSVTVWLLAAVSALASWFVIYVLVLSGVQEQRRQEQLYTTLRQELALGTAPTAPPITPGSPVAVLDAPAASIHRTVVVEGTSSGVLESGPGHRRDSVLPGQAGVSVIMARGLTFGAPFRHISGLAAGDALTVTTQQGTFRYLVIDVRRPGELAPAAPAAGQGRLTLVTAVGSSWRSAFAPGQVVYVDATLSGEPVASAPLAPAILPSSEGVMSVDDGVLMALVLWLEALVVAGVGLVFVRARWGWRAAWLVGTPVLLAVIWGASSAAAQLLPNLL
jgi:sortase A